MYCIYSTVQQYRKVWLYRDTVVWCIEEGLNQKTRQRSSCLLSSTVYSKQTDKVQPFVPNRPAEFNRLRGKTASVARILSPKQTGHPLPCLLIQSFFYGLGCQSKEREKPLFLSKLLIGNKNIFMVQNIVWPCQEYDGAAFQKGNRARLQLTTNTTAIFYMYKKKQVAMYIFV